MAHVVPLIRAAALVPFVHWLNANGRPTERRLAAADLAGFSLQDPERPIPLLNAGAFLRDMSRHEGPDIGCRVVSSASVRELATLGRVALGARTPGEALRRVAAALPHHCTHEHITLERYERGTVVRELFALPLDDETRHVIQQYVAALIRALCAMTGAAGPFFARVELAPHPRAGVAHLGWLGADVVASGGRALALWIDDAVMSAPFPAIRGDRTGERLPEQWKPLRGDGSFAASARAAMGFLLADRPPTLERLAAAAGTTVRTLQRRLGADDTTFSALLDELRRAEALEILTERHGPSIGDVSAMLGYAQQTSLTRAVRRWTGAPPRSQRQSKG